MTCIEGSLKRSPQSSFTNRACKGSPLTPMASPPHCGHFLESWSRRLSEWKGKIRIRLPCELIKPLGLSA